MGMLPAEPIRTRAYVADPSWRRAAASPIRTRAYGTQELPSPPPSQARLSQGSDAFFNTWPAEPQLKPVAWREHGPQPYHHHYHKHHHRHHHHLHQNATRRALSSPRPIARPYLSPDASPPGLPTNLPGLPTNFPQGLPTNPFLPSQDLKNSAVEEATVTMYRTASHRTVCKDFLDMTEQIQKGSLSNSNEALIQNINSANRQKELTEHHLVEVLKALEDVAKSSLEVTEALSAKEPPVWASEVCHQMMKQAAMPAYRIEDTTERTKTLEASLQLQDQMLALQASKSMLSDMLAKQQHTKEHLLYLQRCLTTEIARKGQTVNLDMMCLNLQPGSGDGEAGTAAQMVTPDPIISSSSSSSSQSLSRRPRRHRRCRRSLDELHAAAKMAEQNCAQICKEASDMMTGRSMHETKVHNNLVRGLASVVSTTHTNVQLLEKEHSRLTTQLLEEEDMLSSLKESMQEQVEPLEVARSRLAIRMDRLGAEMVEDEAQNALVGEVTNLQASIARLTTEHDLHASNFNRLLGAQRNVQKQLGILNGQLHLRAKMLNIQEGYTQYCGDTSRSRAE